MFMKPDLLQSRFTGLLLKTGIIAMPIAQCVTATQKNFALEQFGVQKVLPSLIETKATELLRLQKNSSFYVPDENP
jgi:hypothetical protein